MNAPIKNISNINDTAIGVFCYKRPKKLQESMQALLKNPECSSLDVHFFADGYKNDLDMQGVYETRLYIDSLTGFKSIHKHFRETNYSTGPNFFSGINFLRENYRQFIVVEDDLVVTPNYLSYMIQALAFYRDHSSVFCISGYCFPLKIQNYCYDTIMHRRFCSYGWASWSKKLTTIKWHAEDLIKLKNTTPNFKHLLNQEGHDLYRMVEKQIKGIISTWDIQMQMFIAANGLKVAYPKISKTKNIGFDNESTNTFGIDYLKTPQDEGSQQEFYFCPPGVEVAYLQKQLKRPYGLKALVKRKVVNTFIKLSKVNS